MSDDAIIQEAREAFQLAADAEAENRREALDDIILMSGADNDFIGIEALTDKELATLRDRCAERAQAHADLHAKVNEKLEQRKAKPKGGAARRKPAAHKAA